METSRRFQEHFRKGFNRFQFRNTRRSFLGINEITWAFRYRTDEAERKVVVMSSPASSSAISPFTGTIAFMNKNTPNPDWARQPGPQLGTRTFCLSFLCFAFFSWSMLSVLLDRLLRHLLGPSSYLFFVITLLCFLFITCNSHQSRLNNDCKDP